MPNYIRNLVRIHADKKAIDAFWERYSTKHLPEHKKAFDGSLVYKKGDQYGWLNEKSKEFQVTLGREKKMLPDVPKGFEPVYTTEYTELIDFDKVVPPPDDPAYHDKPSQEVAKHSENWWYVWRPKNWGTKWHGNEWSEVVIGNDVCTFSFETPWSTPTGIWEAMALQLPELGIEEVTVEYADEDAGRNCGKAIIRPEGVLYEKPQSNSKIAYEQFFRCWPDRRGDFYFNGTTYEYKDVEDDDE